MEDCVELQWPRTRTPTVKMAEVGQFIILTGDDLAKARNLVGRPGPVIGKVEAVDTDRMICIVGLWAAVGPEDIFEPCDRAGSIVISICVDDGFEQLMVADPGAQKIRGLAFNKTSPGPGYIPVAYLDALQ